MTKPQNPCYNKLWIKERLCNKIAKVRINRRVLNPIIGERFAVYSIEYLDKFGYWRESHNFTDKATYNDWISTYWNSMGKLEKVGDWKSHPEL